MRIFSLTTVAGDYLVMATDKYDAVRVFRSNGLKQATAETVKDWGTNMLFATQIYAATKGKQ